MSQAHVSMRNYAYHPSTLTVKSGSTVTWTNDETSNIPHTVTRTTNRGPVSGIIWPGQTFTHTFTQSGSYAYRCELHPEMRGTVTVVE